MCYYRYCQHQNDDNNLISVNGKLYHEECYKSEQDFSTFERIWTRWINRNVNINYVYAAEIDLLRRGYSTDYILFGLKYVMKKDGWKLTWPAGLKYYLERPEVETAYKEERYKKARLDMEKRIIEKENYPLDLSEPVVKPKINYKKNIRFDSILGGK